MYWDVYDSMLSVHGDTVRERNININRLNFARDMVDNPGYKEHCKRNGEPQRFVVDRSDVSYKYKFMAFPGEELYAGDLIECDGEFFVITEPPRVLNEFIMTGIGWQCNHKFRWQDSSSRIVEQWGVLHSGVYSTTVTNDDQVSVPDKQFKVYMPYNDVTKKLYVDKRLAVDTRFDSRGNEILEVYRITGMNKVARSYGNGAHLLIFELRSDTYSAQTDSLEHMLCDYIPLTQDADDGWLSDIQIYGRNSIRIGTSRKYTVKFSDCMSEHEINEFIPIWTIVGDTDGMSYSVENGTLHLSIDDHHNMIGKICTIVLSSEDGAEIDTMKVEVTS